MVRRSSLLLTLAAALLLGACGGAVQSPHAPPVGEADTTLGIGDVFAVRVYGEADLSGDYRVARDGTITYPFLGELAVAGLEPPALGRLIASGLTERQYLRSPQVSVFVREYNSKRISVSGAVHNGGAYPVQPNMLLSLAIGAAGGFTPLADRNGTVVSRRIDGRLRRFNVPAGSILQGQAEDFPLQAGDIVYVPERVF